MKNWMWRVTAIGLGTCLVGGCGGDGKNDDDRGGSGGDECVSDTEYFEQQVWAEVVEDSCLACHIEGGAARESEFVMVPTAVPNFLEVNMAVMADLALNTREGESLLVLKPTAAVAHEGGLQADEEAAAILREFVDRVNAPVTCGEEEEEAGEIGVELLSPEDTLRRASLLLVNRAPTADELESVTFGGEAALVETLDAMMREDAFIDRMMNLMNDTMLTDRYLGGQRALSLLDDEDYPARYWYESLDDDGLANQYRDRANRAVAREPLQLLAHILRNDLPAHHLLTADYTIVNGYSAVSYGVPDATIPEIGDPAADEFYTVQLDGYPHAGVLTMPAFLNRYPTTATNRNRHRSRIFFDYFLATDILSFSGRPLDPNNASDYQNPTREDAQCTVCHATLDPVAGAFQNWDDDGALRPPDEGWYPEMFEAGFGDIRLTGSDRQSALRWLGENAYQDSRFPLAMIRWIYRGLLGREPVLRPEADASDSAWAAYNAQSDDFEHIAALFVESDYDLRVIVRELVLSHYFRGDGLGSAAPGYQQLAGRARLLTPLELDAKIAAMTGIRWARNWDGDSWLAGDYRLLYGGIDSDGVTRRLDQPNGIMVNIAERMATEVACDAVPYDFVRSLDDRMLFPTVETNFVPESDEGFEIPEAVASIRESIQHLHYQLLGESLDINDPEIDATYQLWYDTWQEGRALVASGDVGRDLPWQCQARTDLTTGVDLPEDRRVSRDEDYTIRAWMAVVTYMLTDYRFLYE